MKDRHLLLAAVLVLVAVLVGASVAAGHAMLAVVTGLAP